MQRKTNEKGMMMPVILGIGAVIILGGAYILFSTEAPDDEAQSLSAEGAAGTRMAGDPALDEMSEAELAADGLPPGPPDFVGPGDQEPSVQGPGNQQPPTTEAEMSDPDPLVPAAAAGTFEAYSPAKLALAETGDVVLFFHADWCPSCRALEANVEANRADIPAGVHLLRVDYDTEVELKKKYGVVRQHTLVQVDANGNLIKTLTGLNNTLDQVVAQI